MPAIPAVRYALLIILILGIIFVSSSVPNLRFWPNEVADVAIRKVGHAGVYFTLALLIALFAARWLPRPIAGALAVGVVLMVALADEVNQSTVVGREASLVDVAIDGVAAIAAALVYLGFSIARQRATSDRS